MKSPLYEQHPSLLLRYRVLWLFKNSITMLLFISKMNEYTGSFKFLIISLRNAVERNLRVKMQQYKILRHKCYGKYSTIDKIISIR